MIGLGSDKKGIWTDHFDWSKENKKIIVDPTLFTLSCCVSYQFLGYISKVLLWWLTIFGVIPMVFPLLANHLWYWCLVLVSRLFIWGAASGIGALSWDRPTHLCSPYQPNNLYNLLPIYTSKHTYMKTYKNIFIFKHKRTQARTHACPGNRIFCLQGPLVLLCQCARKIWITYI